MRTYALKPNQPQRKSSTQLARSNRMTRAARHEAHPLLNLQRTIGNQAVLRLLQARSGGLEARAHNELGTTTRFAHDFSPIPVHLQAPTTPQAKLTVNTPGDSYEQEADQIAEQVMRMPEPQLQRAVACGGGGPSGPTEQPSHELPPLQTKQADASASGQTTTPTIVPEVLASPGQPLDTATRAFMEPRFGHDFSRVRVHSGAAAEQSAREVNAHAYTVGHNMVFGAGRFAPQTQEGQRLIAHELTHVVQQLGSNGIRRGQSNDKSGPSSISHTLAARVGIQRQRETAGTMTDADRREFVRDATKHFTKAAEYFANNAVDAAGFERVINGWYGFLADREELIKELGGDAKLTNDLRVAYTVAIRALMKRAAFDLKRPETDLYRENSGRIPIWAWQQPHHMEPNISTPIPEGRSSNAFGEVKFNVNGWDVTIMPDGRDPRISGAQTRLDFNPGNIPTPQRDASGNVTDFSVPTPKVTIQTFYGPGTTASSKSASGRGTTKADVAGGRVTKHSTSLGFHEGHHGLDYVEFLQSNPPPRFTGAKGQTNAQFNNAIRAWDAALKALNANASRFSNARTH